MAVIDGNHEIGSSRKWPAGSVAKRSEGLLDRALHGREARLSRETVERRPVVGEVDPDPVGAGQSAVASPRSTSSISAMRARSPLRGSSLRMRV